MDNQGIQIGEYTKEINRYEERLIGIRHEVEEIDRVKRKSQDEIGEVLKHLEFLKTEEVTRGAEVERKRGIIVGLDAQIADKQGQFDRLQNEVSTASRELEAKVAEKQETERKMAEHEALMVDEHAKIHEKRRITEENHQLSAEKLDKIQEFIKNLK